MKLLITLVIALTISQSQSTFAQNPSATNNPAPNPAAVQTLGTAREPIVVVIQRSNEDRAQGDQESKDRAEKAALDRAMTADTTRLANYAFWAFVVSSIVAAIGIGQIWLLIRSANDSRRAATAAEQSAKVARDALLFTDRPWLIPSIHGGGLYQRDKPSPGKTLASATYELTSSMYVTNHGKSPVTVEAYESKVLSQGSWQGMENPLITAYEIVMPGDRFDLKTPSRVSATILVTQENKADVLVQRAVMVGRVWYRSPHGMLMVLSFAFIQSASGSRTDWSRYGGNDFNYDREEKNPDIVVTKPP